MAELKLINGNDIINSASVIMQYNELQNNEIEINGEIFDCRNYFTVRQSCFAKLQICECKNNDEKCRKCSIQNRTEFAKNCKFDNPNLSFFNAPNIVLPPPKAQPPICQDVSENLLNSILKQSKNIPISWQVNCSTAAKYYNETLNVLKNIEAPINTRFAVYNLAQIYNTCTNSGRLDCCLAGSSSGIISPSTCGGFFGLNNSKTGDCDTILDNFCRFEGKKDNKCKCIASDIPQPQCLDIRCREEPKAYRLSSQTLSCKDVDVSICEAIFELIDTDSIEFLYEKTSIINQCGSGKGLEIPDDTFSTSNPWIYLLVLGLIILLLIIIVPIIIVTQKKKKNNK